jgi:hypothetical protein
MFRSPLSRAAAVAGALLSVAVPAVAQTAGDTSLRPHHPSYGDDSQYRKKDAELPLPADRTASHDGYRRPHHADY